MQLQATGHAVKDLAIVILEAVGDSGNVWVCACLQGTT